MSRITPVIDDTCYVAPQDLPLAEKVSDESFEALEKMCDKTASDPNSTLFQYLHSDHQEQILADAKKRSTGDGVVVELLEETEIKDPLLAKFSDCTLLDDIEAPSRIWENTMVVETGLIKTSPVKMVGLLRPSTIMEEGGDESVNSDISSQMSFQTATKGFRSDVSSTYDTALESTATSTRTDMKNKRLQDEEINVDDILELAIERSRELAAKTSLLPHIFVSEPNKITQTQNEIDNETDVKDASIDLIDLEKTFGPLRNSPHSSMLGDTAVDIVVIDDDEEQSESEDGEAEEESVIDILSDEGEIEEEYSNIERKKKSTSAMSFNKDTYDFDDRTFDDNKENVMQESLSCDRSMKFNDTMEEVEYLLKKGMEYMAAKDLQSLQPVDTTHIMDSRLLPPPQTLPLVNPVYPSKPQPKPTTQLRVCRTQPNSPMTNLRLPNHGTSSATKVKESTLKTPAKASHTPSKCLPIGMRPFPKFDVFGGRSPKNIANHPRQKELSSKQPFSHIVSPVGAYMKKTASTPLMSTGKMKNTNSNSAAFRELEYESRLYELKLGTNTPSTQCGSGLPALPGITGVPQTLPKKAYISSELKHIVDERTPFTIPGGNKIQKYLETAMMPAVLRHDGKMKFPGAPNVPNTTTTLPQPSKTEIKTSHPLSATSIDINAATVTTPSRRNNASLADLSVMSGDVSMYTIMDAQKF